MENAGYSLQRSEYIPPLEVLNRLRLKIKGVEWNTQTVEFDTECTEAGFRQRLEPVNGLVGDIPRIETDVGRIQAHSKKSGANQEESEPS